MNYPSTLRRIPTPLARLIDGVCARENVSISKLARMVDVNHSYIGRIRAGDRLPSRELSLLMIERWPLTETEKVELSTHFQFIPPGYRLVPNGEWEQAISQWVIAAVGGTR